VQLGVFTQWLKAASIEELAGRVRALNLQCVVLDSYPGLDIDLTDPAPAICHRIKAAFAGEGVEIAAVGGYYNLAHPNPAERQAIHMRFRGLMGLCESIGAPMLCSEAGTYHPHDEWEWDPANATEQAFALFVEAMRPLVAAAGDCGITIGLEPYVMTIINTPERAARLIEELASPHIKLVCDPAGLLTRSTLTEQRAFLPEAFRLIAPSIGLVHVEDCRPDPQGHFLWLPAGQGLIDYPLFMEQLVQAGYDGPLILEHLSEADLPPAREYVQAHWNRAHTQEGTVHS
jgi:sugar phosphate isomerase/epimerase